MAKHSSNPTGRQEPAVQAIPATGLGWRHARSLAQPNLAEPPPGRHHQTRRRSRRLRWLWRALLALALLAALLGGLWFLLNNAYFRIQHVTVAGTSNAQILAGIQALHLEGENIFLADIRQDAARIRALPAVADASISRSLPDTLVIQVRERQPVLLWQVGSQQFSVDASGTLIALLQAPTSLPVVIDEHQRDLAGKPLAPGGKIDPAIVNMARQLLIRLPRELGLTRFSLRETLAYGMVVMSAEGWLARFGSPEDLENKIQMLGAILHIAQQRQQTLALVDLRFGFYPYYRLQAPTAGG